MYIISKGGGEGGVKPAKLTLATPLLLRIPERCL